MNTKQLAKSALLCALYGVLLVADQAGAMMISTMVPWMFSLPSLVEAILFDRNTSLSALAAMAVMTFLLSSFSVWIWALPFLLAGWICGASRREGWNGWASFFVCVLLLAAANYLSLTLFSALFGYDQADQAMIESLLQGILSWQGFLGLSSLAMGALESAAVFSFGTLIVRKLPLHLPAQSWALHIWPGFSLCFVTAALAVLILFLPVVSCPVRIRDIVVVLALLLGVIMIYAGVIHYFQTRRNKPSFWKTLIVLASAFVPGIQLIWLGMGWLHLTAQALKLRNFK